MAKKRSLFTQTFALVLLTVALSAALTAFVFYYYGGAVFSDIKANEILPRAKYLASTSADYLQRKISLREYDRTLGPQHKIWDASLYIYNAKGELFVYPDQMNEAETSAIESRLSAVLAGESLYSQATFRQVGVIIGEPILGDDGAVLGAVFMIKPVAEVDMAIESLTFALLISMLGVTIIMVLPAYLGARGLIRPLRQMTEVSRAMSEGDFSIRAYDSGGSEIAVLGRALNDLSSKLSGSIDELTFERNRLRAVLFGLREGIVAVNAAGEIMQYNPSAVRLMGGTENDSPAELPAYKEIQDELIEVLRDAESRTREIACGEATLRFTMTALNAEDGKIEGAVTLVQDVTEELRLEQTRRDYVANVSHELRTPIASIRSLADALNDGLIKTEEDRARYYAYILTESMRLSRLINDLLSLSRLQSGTVALKKYSMPVGEMVLGVVERYENSAREKGMTLTVSMPGELETVYSNPDRVEEVLIALIDNAVRYAEIKGEIEVSVADNGDYYTIGVKNPGNIGEPDIHHLFERFYKVDKSHSGSGTGLGLSIAREIMDLLEEDISAKNVGDSVFFSFTLHKYAPKNLKNQ